AFAEQLLTRIVREKLPLVAVVGASGSGKSSIVRAGLLPRLRHEKAPTWEVAIFTPSTAPFRNLAEALVLVENPHLDRWERLKKAKERGEDLASGEVSISEAVEITLEASKGAGRLLLVVDQFEELFTLTSEANRKPFCDALLAATQTSQ